MTNDSMDFSDTIAPKSDQMNADDLLTGPITITVADISRGSHDQPVVLHIEGRQPYKPCKSMRRVLVAVWGEDGYAWVGRSMRLYRDPDVKYGGVKMGGIRISHMSHIDSEVVLPLTITRGKRSPFTVKPLADAPRHDPVDGMTQREIVDAMTDGGLLGEAKKAREALGLDPEDKSVEALRSIYRRVLQSMKN